MRKKYPSIPSKISKFRSPISPSMAITVLPAMAREKARLAVRVVFPTPPLPETILMIVPITDPHLMCKFGRILLKSPPLCHYITVFSISKVFFI